MNIIEFVESNQLTPGNFEGDSWEPMKSVLSAAFALPMTKEQRNKFIELAGERKPPAKRVRELWVIAGRRSAKTNTAALIAVYLATIGAETDGLLNKLKPGERGVVSLIAVDREQAKVLFNYITGVFESCSILSSMVSKKNTETIDLTNRVSIEVHTNSFKAVRGRTLISAIFDECAFYRDEKSATPDTELYRAIVPGLATTGGMLIGISSPYAKRGLLYDKWKQHYGKENDVLVVQGATRTFNPTISQAIIDEAIADDPGGAQSEWLGLFRDDVSDFLQRDIVEAAGRGNYLELPPNNSEIYFAFVDPAGGGSDEFTLSIGHKEKGKTVIDLVRGRRGTPAAIVKEYAEVMRGYHISKATSDKYAGQWPVTEFLKHGITVDQSAKPKSQLYGDALSIFNSEQVEIPPDDILFTQLCSLERRTSRSGADSIDHPPGGHDDRANAVCGLLSLTNGKHFIDYSELI